MLMPCWQRADNGKGHDHGATDIGLESPSTYLRVLTEMQRLATLSLVLALMFAPLAFTGTIDTAYWVSRVCFLVFLLLFIVSATASALRS